MSAYSDLILAEPGLTAYWRLNEASGFPQDSEGTAHVTSISNLSQVTRGDTASYMPGDPPSSWKFLTNGVANVPGAATTPRLPPPTFSVELWVQVIALPAPGTFPGFLKRGPSSTGGSSGGWVIFTEPGGAILYKRSMVTGYDSGSTAYNNPGGVVTAGVWNHFVWTCSAVGADLTQTLYLNGSLAAQFSNPGGSGSNGSGGYSTLTNSVAFEIGHGDEDTNNHRIQNVALYNTELTLAKVQQHYAQGILTDPVYTGAPGVDMRRYI